MNPNEAEVAAISGLPNLATNPARYGYEDVLIPDAIAPAKPIVLGPDALFTIDTGLQVGNKEVVVRRRETDRPHDDVPPGNPAYEPSKILPAVEL
jgi:hypothetical protein